MINNNKNDDNISLCNNNNAIMRYKIIKITQ